MNEEAKVGRYLNRKIGTDIDPIGKIMSVNGNLIVLANVEGKLKENFTPDIAIGGFLGNCVNNDKQEYDFIVDENSKMEIKLTKSMFKSGYFISDKPQKFYDYNF